MVHVSEYYWDSESTIDFEIDSETVFPSDASIGHVLKLFLGPPTWPSPSFGFNSGAYNQYTYNQRTDGFEAIVEPDVEIIVHTPFECIADSELKAFLTRELLVDLQVRSSFPREVLIDLENKAYFLRSLLADTKIISSLSIELLFDLEPRVKVLYEQLFDFYISSVLARRDPLQRPRLLSARVSIKNISPTVSIKNISPTISIKRRDSSK